VEVRVPRHQIAGFLVIGALFVAVSPTLAHHSVPGQFDTSKPITLKGVISKVDWINPHIYVHLDVKGADGSTAMWALSTLPTAMMRRAGLTKETLQGKPGEEVTINAVPARDGSRNLGWINKITYADGHSFSPTGQ
jgi:hypothetical protein